MWRPAERVLEAITDVTIGTAIVVIHATLAQREHDRTRRLVDKPALLPRTWKH